MPLSLAPRVLAPRVLAPRVLAPRVLALALVVSAFVTECAARSPPPSAQPVIVSPDATTSAPAEKLSLRGRTLIPLHSTLIGQGGVTRLNFSGALSIHNASATNVLAIEKIEYRSGSGQLIESYLNDPIYLKPYASLQVLIAQDDVRGGTGASFTVDWSTSEGSDEPLIEAVMTSYTGPHSYAILSPGRRVSRSQ
ncbi:MAG: hypothetical protein FD139_1541 [Methylocystaceae bacterium]|nr:MAG: hypothetical protein FD172_263 [Methylocystaceae bacterium]TXT45602.1 MAG: hypothetical protein FD139_1541 [Methylocystaceae bacterium]